MTSDDGDAGDRSARALLVVLATTSKRMFEVWSALRANQAVARVDTSCDTSRFSDPFRDEWDMCSFDAYAEVTTHSGVGFSWGVQIWMTSSGWEFYRWIKKDGTDGQDTISEFDDVRFKSIDDLTRGFPALMDEFVESARHFDFEIPHKSASSRKSS